MLNVFRLLAARICTHLLFVFPGWIVELSRSDVEEIDAAVAGARAFAAALGEIGRAEFPLPDLSRKIADWAAEFAGGRGFLLVCGLAGVEIVAR